MVNFIHGPKITNYKNPPWEQSAGAPDSSVSPIPRHILWGRMRHLLAMRTHSIPAPRKHRRYKLTLCVQ